MVCMYLHSEDDGDENGDCIWIKRPFVAENAGADLKQIDGTLGLGEIPSNLDRLRIEVEKTERKQEQKRRQRICVFLRGVSRQRGGERKRRRE